MTTENQNTNENQAGNENTEHFVEFNGEKLPVPENFWDTEKNSVNTGAILKSQMDLRKQIGEDLSPKDGYKINIPEELKDVITPDPDNPLYKAACEFAKKHKISQEDFDNLCLPYFQELAQPFINADSFMKEEEAKLDKIFGNKKDEVKNRIRNFIDNSGLKDNRDVMDELSQLTVTAAGIQALNALISSAGNNMAAVGELGKSSDMTEDELKEMMKDPRYWRDHDASFVKKVTEGFQKLYPE